MPCNNFRSQLSLFTGDELDPTAMLAVEAHVRDCPTCRRTTAAFRAQRTILGRFGRGLDSLGAAPELFSGLSRQLDATARTTADRDLSRAGRAQFAGDPMSSPASRSAAAESRGPAARG